MSMAPANRGRRVGTDLVKKESDRVVKTAHFLLKTIMMLKMGTVHSVSKLWF